MAETETSTKSKTEYTTVRMTDGRDVQFAGKRKVNKEVLIDETKIQIDGDVIQLEAGAISQRFDFRNGETRTNALPLALLAQYAGHGALQKFGDEFAASANDPMSEEDMVLAYDALMALHQSGKWGEGRASGGGGVSGAGIVVRAILEDLNSRRGGDTGKPLLDVNFVKTFLQKKLDDSADRDGENKLTRRALYDSFRAPGTPVAAIIERMEKEKKQKEPAVNAAAVSNEMEAAAG